MRAAKIYRELLLARRISIYFVCNQKVPAGTPVFPDAMYYLYVELSVEFQCLLSKDNIDIAWLLQRYRPQNHVAVLFGSSGL